MNKISSVQHLAVLAGQIDALGKGDYSQARKMARRQLKLRKQLETDIFGPEMPPSIKLIGRELTLFRGLVSFPNSETLDLSRSFNDRGIFNVNITRGRNSNPERIEEC